MADIAELYYSVAEDIRNSIKTLRTNIQFSCIDKPAKTITLTSSLPDEGKSALVAFLGIAMAEAGKRTLICECDFRRPMQANLFKLRTKLGIVHYLTQQCSLEEAVVQTKVNGLFLLDSESKVINPVEMIGSDRFNRAVGEMRENFDIVLFDTPPINSFIDGALVASQADGTVVVIRSGITDYREVQSTLAQLKKANAHILGVALNAVPKDTNRRYYDYYYTHSVKKNSRDENPPDIKKEKAKQASDTE